jgi:hypothetical protein
MLVLIIKQHSSSSSVSRMTTATSLQMPPGMTSTTHLVGSSALLLAPIPQIHSAMATQQQQQQVNCLPAAVQLLLCLQFAAHQQWQLAMQRARLRMPLQGAQQQQQQTTLVQQQRTSKLSQQHQEVRRKTLQQQLCGMRQMKMWSTSFLQASKPTCRLGDGGLGTEAAAWCVPV